MLFYLGGYGLGRGLIETLRTDQLHLWNTNIPVSQMLGFSLFVLAVVADVVVRYRMHAKIIEKQNKK